MAYDRLEESKKLLGDGVPDVPFALSRRRRFIPAAVDVDGDVAATLFVRRGVSGNPWLEWWTLERRSGGWVVLGGGGGDGHDELFEGREAIDGLVVPYGGGWTARSADRRLPWPNRGVAHAEMRLAPSVVALAVRERIVAVPAHGLAIVVWSSRRPPRVTALAANGKPLGEITMRAPKDFGRG